MTIIVIISIVIYAILVTWCWHNLGRIEKSKKIIYIIIGMIIIFIITNIVYSISKADVSYPEEQIEGTVRNTLLLVFTALNGLIVMPYIAKQLDRIREKEIEKEKFTKKMILLLIVFILCLILESGYLKDTQLGILEIYNSLK